MQVRIGCEFHYQSTWPTPAVFQVLPRTDDAPQITQQTWETTPELPHHDYVDMYGNLCRRLTIPEGNLAVRYDALVDLSSEPDPTALNAGQALVQDLPDETLVYTLPSRYCLSDVLSDTAWQLFGNIEPGWARVQAISDYVHDRLRFQYGSSTPMTTAVDVYEACTGVCRDFAHLGVTFCRALNIPARYVFGYLPDIGVPPPDAPMDFCGWFEAFLDGRWWTFDPRNNARRIGRVVIGRGRDALDVAMVTSYGPARLQNMIVWADEVSGAPGTRVAVPAAGDEQR